MIATQLALAVLLAAPPAAQASPTPDRQNALAFENGALLLAEPPGYGTGIGSWSAWHLTDGDERQGWCSAAGKPVGGAFVWELDTTWALDAFVVSTRNMQEDGYPGISARTVELHVGDGTSFTRVGAFDVGKGERKEFSLPRGTAGRKVKVVVAANHGHKEYTEIAELELFGARTGQVAPPRIAGDFGTDYGPMRFAVEGDDVLGCYDWTDGAAVDGTIAGRTARVVWSEFPDGKLRQGTAIFAVSTDGNELRGVWYEGGELRGAWSGNRIERSAGAKCTPRRKSQLATLKTQKRLVLYGIRFDSNADVPRPESGATLDEVAGLLKEDVKLRLLVEGHTDATNTDAYNLDLSQRRAQAVVAALVTRGVEPVRLRAKGFGRSRPVADNATAQGRALNRRVEVSVTE